MRIYLVSAILAALAVKGVEGYAYYFASSTYCYQQLYDGVTMMNNVVNYGSSKSAVVKRGSTTLSTGDYYVAGETLTVSISSSATQYAFQVADGSATFTNGACSNTRYANGQASLVMPSSGSVTINGAWANSEGGAVMFNDIVLNCCSTKAPSVNPTTKPTSQSPTVKPTAVPSLSPSVAPTTTVPTTIQPTAALTEPTYLPTIVPTALPTAAPSVRPTVKPTGAPSFAATEPPSAAPSAVPTYLTETLITYQLSQVVNNVTTSVFLDNSDAFLAAMSTSLNTFLPPETLTIHSPTADRRLSAVNVGSLTVVYNAAYILESTDYSTSEDLQGALTIANNIISNSNLFVTNLKDQDVPALIGVSSTSADGVTVGSTQALITTTPSVAPTPGNFEESYDDKFYNGSTTTKVVVGVIVGFFGVLFWLGALHYYLFNHETLSAVYGAVAVKLPAWLAVAMGITAIILVSCWATSHGGDDYAFLGKPSWKDNVFAYHPVFLVAGFYVAQLIAINNWVLFSSHDVGKAFHVLFQLAGLAFMIAGMCAVVKFKMEDKTPSLTTMHSWIGVWAIAIFCVNYIMGFFMGLVTAMWPDSVLRKALDLRRIHQALGLISIGLTTIAVVSGIMDQLSFGYCFYTASVYKFDKDPAQNYPYVYDSCRVAYGLGIVTVIGSILTVLSVSLRTHEKGPIAPNQVVIPSDENAAVEMVPTAQDDKAV